MSLPGFSAEAGLSRLSRGYDLTATRTGRPRTGVEMAIISGGCAPNGTYSCAEAWQTCQYYAAITSHSGADVSNCCEWYVLHCNPSVPSSGGGGGGNGGPIRHRGPAVM
jgi:hypothetical protein